MEADLVLTNAKIRTMDRQSPIAEAVAVRCGRIVAVGDKAAVGEWITKATKVWDAQGGCVLPGFCDSHIHLVEYGLGLERVRLDGLPSLGQAVERINVRASQVQPGEWVLGRGWNHNLWPGSRFPSRHDLDPVTPRNPVYLPGKDGHSAWVNSLALTLAGLDSHTVDPPGGALDRDPRSGDLTGILKEGPAMEWVERVIGRPSLETRSRGVRLAVSALHQHGIASVHSAEDEEGLETLQVVEASGHLTLRVNVMIPDGCVDALRRIRLHSGFGGEFLRLGPVKIFADGALGSRTADMFESYCLEPGNRGIEVTTSLRLEELIEGSLAGGLSVAVHAIGDRANSRVLDVLEKHQDLWRKRGLRPRIEHVQLLAPGDAQRLGSLGIVASMQPIHCTSDMLMADRFWGERSRNAYAWRSLKQAGAVLAFGSDAPVEVPNIIHGLHAAVTRQRADGTPTEGWYPEERLTAEEAVEAYTLGGAYAAGEESSRGSITVGKVADMTVLSQDPITVSPDELLSTQVMGTVVDGEVVFRR